MIVNGKQGGEILWWNEKKVHCACLVTVASRVGHKWKRCIRVSRK